MFIWQNAVDALMRSIMGLLLLILLSGATRADYVNRVYWTLWTGTDGVCRANVDGSDVQQLLKVEFSSLDGLAIDRVDQKLYVGTSYDLLRCNLDGSGVETVISGGIAFNFYGLEIDAASRKMYWSDFLLDGTTPSLRRANLDGTSMETIWQGAKSYGKAIDPAAGKLYWAADAIYRSDLDGANPEVLLANTFGKGNFHGLDLDPRAGKLYFSTWESGGIWRANLDGSGAEYLIDDKTSSLALDLDGGKIYWTSWAIGSKEIMRANLDGTEAEVVCLMGGQGNSIALEIIPEPTTFTLLTLGLLALVMGTAGQELRTSRDRYDHLAEHQSARGSG